MLNRIIIVALIFCGMSSSCSQDCFDKIAKQAVEIDSLQKVISDQEKLFNDWISDAQNIQKALLDTIKTLRADLSSLEKFKSQRKSINDLLKTKSDSIAFLKTQLVSKDQLIAVAKQDCDQKVRAEYLRGKSFGLEPIILSYKKPFDDLIKSSSRESLHRDISLVGNNPEVKPILDDLQIYFNALELLSKKFHLVQIRNAEIQLNQLQQQSTMLDKLKENIKKYQIFNEGLEDLLNKLVTLDERESVAGMGDEIQKLKFGKILSELTAYIFNYDFNFTDYPYLSEIVLEAIKRKQPNADADVSDLLKKIK